MGEGGGGEPADEWIDRRARADGEVIRPSVRPSSSGSLSREKAGGRGRRRRPSFVRRFRVWTSVAGQGRAGGRSLGRRPCPPPPLQSMVDGRGRAGESRVGSSQGREAGRGWVATSVVGQATSASVESPFSRQQQQQQEQEQQQTTALAKRPRVPEWRRGRQDGRVPRRGRARARVNRAAGRPSVRRVSKGAAAARCAFGGGFARALSLPFAQPTKRTISSNPSRLLPPPRPSSAASWRRPPPHPTPPNAFSRPVPLGSIVLAMALMEALARLDAVLDRTLELTVHPPRSSAVVPPPPPVSN